MVISSSRCLVRCHAPTHACAPTGLEELLSALVDGVKFTAEAAAKAAADAAETRLIAKAAEQRSAASADQCAAAVLSAEGAAASAAESRGAAEHAASSATSSLSTVSSCPTAPPEESTLAASKPVRPTAVFERSHSPAFRALEEQHHPQRETFLGEPGATQTSLRDAFGCGELINSGSAEVDPAPQRASVDSRRDTVESLEGSLGASDASQLVESTAAIGRVMCEG